MKISYTSIKHYDITNIRWWIFAFRKYGHVKGFIMRVFGIYINFREKTQLKN